MTDFDLIFRTYHHTLVLYANKFVNNEEVSLDLVQDVFTLFWEKKKLNLEQEHMKAYLFRSTRNACLNYLKHQRIVGTYQQKELTHLELDYYSSGEKSMIEQENLQKIYQAIQSLAPIYREVIELSRFEGLKNKEVAKKLDIPLRTVETRLFRALSILKEKLSEKIFNTFLFISYLPKR